MEVTIGKDLVAGYNKPSSLEMLRNRKEVREEALQRVTEESYIQTEERREDMPNYRPRGPQHSSKVKCEHCCSYIFYNPVDSVPNRSQRVDCSQGFWDLLW